MEAVIKDNLLKKKFCQFDFCCENGRPNCQILSRQEKRLTSCQWKLAFFKIIELKYFLGNCPTVFS